MCEVCMAIYGHLKTCPYADDRDPDREREKALEMADLEYDRRRDEQ